MPPGGLKPTWHSDILNKLTTDRATVLRSGQKKEIDSEELVPGHVAFVLSGDNIPADGYILESFDFKVNSFIFTGESKPEKKLAKLEEKKNLTLADIENMVFSGETVTTGEAKFLVTATGTQTELGKIAASDPGS